MSTFPTLKTGVVMQYPARRGTRYSTVTVQFVDGADQRFRIYAAPVHQWVVQLSLLDQTELHQLQEFFLSMNGRAEDFSFTDPRDATNYPSCSLASDSMAAVLAGEWNGQTTLTVLENAS